jgi:hypothetical protein
MRCPSRPSKALLSASSIALTAAFATCAEAAVIKTELAGNSLTVYPHFEYVKAINANAAVEVAIDPGRFPTIGGQTCDVYVVAAKKTAGWDADQTLVDVSAGGKMTRAFVATNIQANTFQVAAPSELSASAGTGLGVGYDVVLDCNQDGVLNGDDYIDGRNNESGFYVVHDTTAPGPLAVTEATYNLSSAVGTTFGIPGTHLAENLFYPTNIATLGQLPLIVISHGNGHWYEWYDHLGNHLASYGYIVMSHPNNTGPGPVSASTTTLGHTDAFINQVAAGAIAGGALTGHLDADRIVWIGHSRGAEGVAIAYDRIFDATHVPANFSKTDIKLISSMLPTDFQGTDVANPHDANYHLWTASGDSDVNGGAASSWVQTYHLHDRAVGHRQSTTVQGTGHGWFHNGAASGGGPAFVGPCSIGEANTHLIEKGHFLPLIKRYVDDNIPSIDFLTRQYERFRPIGVPTSDACIVVSHEYYDGSAGGRVILDNYQTSTATNLSSIGGAVMFDVGNLSEGILDDNNSDFVWASTDPFNGATQASTIGMSPSWLTGELGGFFSDTTRGVVFDWSGADRYYEWEVPIGERDFRDNLILSLRGAQGTQHPNTLANAGDLTFTVTLRDSGGTTSSISSGAFGGGFEAPYARSGGWHNEMETVRIRLTDFLNNGSGLNLGDVVAVRLNVGPSWGSSQGRIVVDDLVLSNDRAVYDGADNGDPHISTVNGVNYDFHGAGEFTVLKSDDMEIQARQTPVPTAAPLPNAHTGLSSCVSINSALAVRVAGRRVTYQPGLSGEANPAGIELRVDGNLVDLDASPTIALGPDARVARSAAGSGVEIRFPDGAALNAIPGWWSAHSVWYLNISVSKTPASEGVMGYVPAGDWLPQRRDGAAMGPRPASLAARHRDLNRTFAKSWRVGAASLFDYAPGQSTATYTDERWPVENATSCALPGREPARPLPIETAKRLCAAIANEADRDNCAADVAATGEKSFAATYLLSQKLERGGTRTEVYVERPRRAVSGKAAVTAVVRLEKSGERLTAREGGADLGSVQFTLNGAKYGRPAKLDAFGRARTSIATVPIARGERLIGAVYLPPKGDGGLLTSRSLDVPVGVPKIFDRLKDQRKDGLE